MQDFLSSLIASLLVLSVSYLLTLFALSMPAYELRIKNRGNVAPAPPPAPSVSVAQADQNLDIQIDALVVANQFPAICRSMLSPTPTTPNKAKAKKIMMNEQIVIETNTGTPSKKMSVADLRALCAAKDIKWRNVHGKNKHLTQLEMIKALEEIER